ncbi:hypothetical protein QFC24_006795 [Naganishia onofrii]|uniref:Uncharacterized protein n=1 Tax=Naganishia onofrii TaxID=1851511 RepID=A0ACC2WYM1_9TREE|nr:hypothetical protein QFC24_006795 [Naganishia onofrii]
MRSAVVDQISRKAMRMSAIALQKHSSGSLIATISADAQLVEACFQYIVDAVADPLTVIIGFILLILSLGPSALILFNVLESPMKGLPKTITGLSDAYVAIGRIATILTAEEKSNRNQADPGQFYAIDAKGSFTYNTAELSKAERVSIKLDKNVDCHEQKRKSSRSSQTNKSSGIQDQGEQELQAVDDHFKLEGIDLQVPRGALVCVIGRIGSGKTALLQALTGEMRQICGKVILGGTVSIAAQNP